VTVRHGAADGVPIEVVLDVLQSTDNIANLPGTRGASVVRWRYSAR
jgi:hypothetical protein